jgi:peptidoglycan/LPS O-acetylase OafA/YrhL
MDFDQMLETWRTQDAAPLYGVNRDALRQALQAEEASVRRVRRRDMWIVYIAGGGTAVLGGLWVAISIGNSWPAIYTVAAGVGFGMVALWVGAYCMSRWRQAKSERNFGNTLQEEVRRTLSRVDIEISRFGHWSAAMLQIAPLMVGALLIAWSVGRSQSDGPDDFGGSWTYLMVVFMTIYSVRKGHRYAKQNLEPRQRRLRELLAALDARE